MAMRAFPGTYPTAYLSVASRIETDMKTALDDWLLANQELPGGLATSAITISSGSAAVVGALHSISSEVASAADTLTTLTGGVAGRQVLIYANDPTNEPITISHEAGGSGEISLADGKAFVLNATTKWLWLVLIGTQWKEVARSYGFAAASLTTFRSDHGFGSVATLTAGTGVGQVPTADQIYGQESVYIPVDTMYDPSPQAVPAASTVVAGASVNRPSIKIRNFDATTPEYLMAEVRMPKDWKVGTAVTFEFNYLHDGTQSAGKDDAQWRARGRAFSDGDSFQQDFSATASTGAKTGATAYTRYAATTGSLSIDGTPAKGDLVIFEFSRQNAGANNLDIDAGLIGVYMKYTTDALNEN